MGNLIDGLGFRQDWTMPGATARMPRIMAEKVRVGVIGCGAISGRYIQTSRMFPILDVVACADLNRAAAEKKAAEFSIPRVLGVEELVADKSIDVVLNLTIPKAHVPVCIQCLEAGKHVYVEKPLATTRAEAQKVVEL